MGAPISRGFIRGRYVAALALVGAAVALAGAMAVGEARDYRTVAAHFAKAERINRQVSETLTALSMQLAAPGMDMARVEATLTGRLEELGGAGEALGRLAQDAGPRGGELADEVRRDVAAFILIAGDVAANPSLSGVADPRYPVLLSLTHNALLPELREISETLARRHAESWARLMRVTVASALTLAATLLVAALAVFHPMERRILLTQAALARETERAQAAERSKGAFLANMSHEIRTSLNGVTGVNELLGRTRLDAEQAEFVRLIRASGAGLLRIINDILDFSKIAANEMGLEVSRFEPARVLVETAQMFAPMTAARGVALDLDLDPSTPRWAMGDAVRLRQIVSNLLQNAAKFTAEGRVELVTQWRAATRTLMILVRDTGVGIPPEKLADIFTAFQQVDNDLTPRHHGTGLGLAISKMLVEKMGGAITVDSAPGKGAAFRVFLPLGAALDVAAEARPLEGLRVGLAMGDDRRDAAMRRTLGWAGAEVSRPADVRLEARLDVLVHAGPPPPGIVAPRRIAIVRPGEAAPAADAALFAPVDPAALVAAVAGGQPAFSTVAPRDGDLAGRRVLVADDNPINRMIACRLLEDLGCAVEAVADGEAAVRATLEGRPDLVLMDVSMPGMNGLEATNAIRRREAGTGVRTPIVALTAHVMREHLDRCAEAGMDGHLPKPFRPEDLADAVRRWTAPSPERRATRA